MRDFLDCLVSFVMKIVSYQLIKRAINQLIIIHFSQNYKHCLQDLGYKFLLFGSPAGSRLNLKKSVENGIIPRSPQPTGYTDDLAA